MRCLCCGLLLVAVGLALSAPKRALPDGSVEAEWLFVWAEPNRDGYEVWQGRGVVKLREGYLTAKLRAKAGPELVLTGRVSDGKVIARVTVVGSEFLDVPFSGTYLERRFHEPQLVNVPNRVESIVLSNGLIVLALRRDTFEPRSVPPITPDR